jgi:hypothetical protein
MRVTPHYTARIMDTAGTDDLREALLIETAMRWGDECGNQGTLDHLSGSEFDAQVRIVCATFAENPAVRAETERLAVVEGRVPAR